MINEQGKVGVSARWRNNNVSDPKIILTTATGREKTYRSMRSALMTKNVEKVMVGVGVIFRGPEKTKARLSSIGEEVAVIESLYPRHGK
jgi:hypothetical protein